MTRGAEAKGLIEFAEPFWDRIRVAAARSLNAPSRKFLPKLEPVYSLGCGVWGCVWPTADKRFLIKLSLDATEGPHTAMIMKCARLDKGVAYFHRIWRLPELVWTDHYGYTPLWIMLREEVDVISTYAPGTDDPAKPFRAVARVLEDLPDCSDELCALIARLEVEDSKNLDACFKKEEKCFLGLCKKLQRGPGEYVGKLIYDMYHQHRIVLGDAHFGNVGLRHHDLRQFKVPSHKKLVVTDLGDQGQAERTVGNYPEVKVLKNPAELDYWSRQVPVLP